MSRKLGSEDSKNLSDSSSIEFLHCQPTYDYDKMSKMELPNTPPQTHTQTTAGKRTATNAKERHRTISVNTAFHELRTLIPTEPHDRKLSKLETLRLASSYIHHLQTVLLAGENALEQPCIHHSALLAHFQGISTPCSSRICTFCLNAVKRTGHGNRHNASSKLIQKTKSLG